MICSGKLTSRPAKHRDARPSPSQAGPQGAGRGKRRLPADGRTLVSPPHKSARGALGGASVACPRTSRRSSLPYPRRADARRGATLLVTLGILTVLSVMAVTFLVTTRLQQQAAAARNHRLAARNHLDEALYLAMRTVEDALCATNFSNVDPAPPVPQRLAPVGRWFSDEWTEKNLSDPDDIQFQASGVLLSPPIQKGDEPRTPEFTTREIRDPWTVNLLTPEVLALIPPALTNGIDLTPSLSSPFRSSWQTLALPSSGRPWHDNPARVAFAIFDVSGFLDANHFITGPTTQKLPRVCFSQADVTNWFANVDHEKISNLKSQISNLDSDRLPFSALSYDPNPNADPFSSDSIEAHPLLGYDAFAFSRQRKFEINTITNLIGNASSSESGDWLLATSLMGEWLRPVYSALARANPQRSGGAESDEDANRHHPDTLSTLQTVSLPWNLLNFIDGDRVPQLSPFANLPDSLERIATRANLAIEDVPLINKVTVFNIFGQR
jgi:type II secretory pathway pseudopilin PulG